MERGPADLQGVHAEPAGRAAGGVWQRGWQEGLQVKSAVVRLQEIAWKLFPMAILLMPCRDRLMGSLTSTCFLLEDSRFLTA